MKIILTLLLLNLISPNLLKNGTIKKNNRILQIESTSIYPTQIPSTIIQKKNTISKEKGEKSPNTLPEQPSPSTIATSNIESLETSLSQNISTESETELILLGTSDFKVLVKSINFFIFLIYNQGENISDNLNLKLLITYQNNIKEIKEISCPKIKTIREILKYNCSLDRSNTSSNVTELKIDKDVKFNKIKPKKIYFSGKMQYEMSNLIKFHENMDIDKEFPNKLLFFKNAKIEPKNTMMYIIFQEEERTDIIEWGYSNTIKAAMYSTKGSSVNFNCLLIGKSSSEIVLINCYPKGDFEIHMNNTIIYSFLINYLIIFDEKENDYLNMTFESFESYSRSNNSFVIHSRSVGVLKPEEIIYITIGGVLLLALIIFLIVRYCWKKRKISEGDEVSQKSSSSNINSYYNNNNNNNYYNNN